MVYEEDITSTDAYGRHTYPIFKDTKLGVYLTPVYSKTNVTINFKYRTPSKTEAMRWRDDMRNKLSQMRDMKVDVVADYYLGSGTTAVVCKELNRNFIGCDINPKAIEITKARLNGGQ